MNPIALLRNKLDTCPAGLSGWKEFEDVCEEVLTFLFVPPLIKPISQARSYSGIDRRDLVFPNRNTDSSNNWGFLQNNLNARMVLFEFKNYDSSEIGKDEVNQTRSYLKKSMGNLAIICCNKPPESAAHIRRNTIFSEDGVVILFVTSDNLKEMLFIKERGEDPSDFIMDLIEHFYLQHE